jgi:hypothetical protein
MSMTTGVRSRLDLGRVLEDIVGVIRTNFVPLLLLALILTGAPSVVSGILQVLVRATPLIIPAAIVIGLASLVLSLVLLGAVTYATVQSLNGGQPQLEECLRAGARTCLLLFVLSLMIGVSAAIGGIFLFVPGVIIILRWSVAIPVLVMEARGLMDSLGRSAVLTKGKRWTIFLLFLIIWVLLAVIELAFVGLLGGFQGAAAVSPLRLLIVAPVFNILVGVIGPVIPAVLYHHLRIARDGVASETLAQVFD